MASWEQYFCLLFPRLVQRAGRRSPAGRVLAAHRLPRMAGHAVPAIVPACWFCSTLWGIWQAGGLCPLFLPAEADWRAERQQIAQTCDPNGWRTEWRHLVMSADDSISRAERWYYQYELYPAVTAVEARQ